MLDVISNFIEIIVLKASVVIEGLLGAKDFFVLLGSTDRSSL